MHWRVPTVLGPVTREVLSVPVSSLRVQTVPATSGKEQEYSFKVQILPSRKGMERRQTALKDGNRRKRCVGHAGRNCEVVQRREGVWIHYP